MLKQYYLPIVAALLFSFFTMRPKDAPIVGPKTNPDARTRGNKRADRKAQSAPIAATAYPPAADIYSGGGGNDNGANTPSDGLGGGFAAVGQGLFGGVQAAAGFAAGATGLDSDDGSKSAYNSGVQAGIATRNAAVGITNPAAAMVGAMRSDFGRGNAAGDSGRGNSGATDGGRNGGGGGGVGGGVGSSGGGNSGGTSGRR